MRFQFLLLALFFASIAGAAENLEIHWDKVETTSKTTPTLQVVVNPPLRRGSAIHDRVFSELKRLGADYVRYVPWLPYPKLAVAELEPPANGETFWDSSLIDPMMEDFMQATDGHSVIVNFSTTPAWMWVTPQPVSYPKDANQVDWKYTEGTQLRDPSGKELGDYYARLVSWYVSGGFTDELGRRHESGHHYRIPYWEVLNEVDYEHNMSPEMYTAIYDAIVSTVKAAAPGMKFVGMALAAPSQDPRMFEYFLDAKNHKPGIPIDMISYHFYATPAAGETRESEQFTFFDQADGFLNSVRFIEQIRKRLAPNTGTTVDEIGCISADDNGQDQPGHVTQPIPAWYWNLCGATYAYVFGNLAKLGIDVAGESQLVGYPTQFPSVSMVDWNTGTPNARFRVLELLKENLGPGERIVETRNTPASVYMLAFITAKGERKLLLINKRNQDVALTLPDAVQEFSVVDETTSDSPPQTRKMTGKLVELHPFAVAVVTCSGE